MTVWHRRTGRRGTATGTWWDGFLGQRCLAVKFDDGFRCACPLEALSLTPLLRTPEIPG